MSTPYKKRAIDSPSRQLLWELNQLAISSQEGFYAHLDRENEEREDLHKQALATAARKHERVRESAEIEKQRVEEEQAAWQRRQEEEQRKALEALRHENELSEQRREVERVRAAQEHERELVEVQRSKAQIEERQKAEAEEVRQNAEDAKKLKEEQDARIQKLREAEAADKQAKEKALTAVQARPQPTLANSTLAKVSPAPQPRPEAGSTQPAINAEWAAEHKRYLEIHRHLKDLRKFMIKTAKERPELKEDMGNMRRAIKKSVGQLNKTKGGNTRPLKTIIDTLKHALTLPSPEIDILTFLATPPPPSTSPQTSTTGPALLVYLLNTFSKDIIAQFLSEASVDPSAADGIGVVASHIFALGFFRWQTHSLIDILLAKLHVVAPALFGIYPTVASSGEATPAGKTRLGWWREEGRSSGPFIDTQQHFMRMTGLAAGFAALSLRNYEKAKAVNPFPEHHYWICLARIASIPAGLMTQTHFVLLKALVEGYESKFIGFYGGAAVAALRELLVELPVRCQSSVASKSLAGLKDVLAREKKLFL